MRQWRSDNAWPYRPAGVVAVIVAMLVLPSIVAATAVDLPAPGDPAWQALEFPKIRRHTAYRVEMIDGSPAYVAEADCSASAMYVAAESIDLERTPILRWRWKLAQGVDVDDQRAKAGDDFAARVYVMFRFASERATLFERAQHSLGTAIYGDVVPGNTVNYVWAANAPVGSKWKSPYTDSSQIVVKRRGESNEWHEEQADVRADYLAAFGHPPPPLLAVAVMSDADNTCQQARAYFADFRVSSSRNVLSDDASQ